MTAVWLADAVGESAHACELQVKLLGLVLMSNAMHMSANDRPRVACYCKAACSCESVSLILCCSLDAEAC